jgi:hypothetical protein
LKSFHYHSLDELSEASDRRETAATGHFWLVNQRYGRLILPTPWNEFILKYQHVTSRRTRVRNDSEHLGRHSDQNAMRDTKMQMHRAASASGRFANVDLNPTRPTTNRIAIRITNAREAGLAQAKVQLNQARNQRCERAAKQSRGCYRQSHLHLGTPGPTHPGSHPYR